MIYIWCVSKLGNIFKSPIPKKIFSRGRFAKSIELHVKLKYAPERSYHKGTRNTLKIMFFFFQGAHHTPKVGCFFNIIKILLFGGFITQLVKKLQQWSLCEMIEDVLPFVLNTKQPLSDIWLLRYKQNSFGCFKKKNNSLNFFENTQNCFAYISATKYRLEAVLHSK